MPVSETFFLKPVKDYMRKKFYIMKGEETVASAVALMKDNGIGSVGVRFSDGHVGILTDRDVVIKVVAAASDPGKVLLKDVAVKEPVTVSQDASLEEAFKLMRDNGILRLIVVDDSKKPVGLLVERWVFAAFVTELLGDKGKKHLGWMYRYINDVTDAAFREFG